MNRLLPTLLAPCILLCLWVMAPVQADSPGGSGSEPTGGAEPGKKAAKVYGLDYEATFMPEQGVVQLRVTVRQERNLLRRVRFDFDPARYRDFEAEGEMELADDRVTWRPPATGGSLSFLVSLNHVRKSGGYDSLLTDEWALFRGDDLFPPAAATAIKGAESKARLRMSGPDGWSFISAYPRDEDDADWYLVAWPGRRFDRPVGWMAAGSLGVRWGTIAGRQIAVAGPMGQGVRHLDILAFLRWNLPELVNVFPAFPRRMLVVSAGDPMWRGGLSGPASLYLHADRPLISANSTSTLLHELVHVAQGYRAAADEDWIVEGIAEFYTLEIMHRSGTISGARYRRGFEKLGEWAEQAGDLESEYSSGARTARGVAVMQELDAELRRRSEGKYSLDDVARQLSEDSASVSVERLREIAAGLAGAPLESISPERLGPS